MIVLKGYDESGTLNLDNRIQGDYLFVEFAMTNRLDNISGKIFFPYSDGRLIRFSFCCQAA